MTGKNGEDGQASVHSASVNSNDEVRQSLLNADETTPLEAQKISVGINDFWTRPKTKEFRDNMGLAVRGGAFILFLGLPFMVPPSYLPWAFAELRRQEIITQVSIVMFIYTLYKTVGETVAFAWQGMAGTFACSLTVYLMFQLMPGGVTPDAPPHHYWCGIAVGLAFTLLTLGLNVSVLAQIFALSNFVFIYMSFMTGDHTGFSSNWEVNTKGAAVSNVLVSFAGVMFAILGSLLPWPILAIWKAREGAQHLTADSCAMWERAVKNFCAESTQAYEIDALGRKRDDLQAGLINLSCAIQNAWWECFGMGSWQRSRLTLTAYARKMAEDHDRLPSLLFACEHNDASQSHSDFMKPLREHMEAVIGYSQILYQKATLAAVAGGIVDDEECNSITESIKRTQGSVESLSQAFETTKKTLGLPLVSSDQMDEHAFCYNLCAHGRLACEMANELIDLRKRATELSIVEGPGALSIFDRNAIFAPTHVSFFVRNSVTIIVCFLVGYFGFPYPDETLIKKHSPGVSSTAAVLISVIKPSMTTNLDRLQGVVLGTVVGQLVFNSLGYCTWWGYLGISLSLFVWTTGTLYMYYNSVKYSLVGCLLAAFGSANFLQGCTEAGEFMNPSKAYHTIVDCVVAIFIICGIDTILSKGRSSDEAYAAYLDFWRSLRRSVECILQPKSQAPKADHADLLAKVQECEILNRLATEEPRWWRTPWRKVAYADGIACATKLRLALKTMEDSIPGQEGEGSTEASSEVLDRMLGLSSFGKIREGVSGQLEQLERFIRIFVHEKEGRMEDLKRVSELTPYASEVRAGIDEFLQESIAEKAFAKEEPCATLEDDNTCELSLFLSSIDDMMTAMRSFQHSILRSA